MKDGRDNRLRGACVWSLAVALVGTWAAPSAGSGEPAGTRVAQADPDRRLEQKQAELDLRRVWRFDDQDPGSAPRGFVASTLGSGPAGAWRIVPANSTGAPSHVLRQEAPCGESGCFHVLLAEDVAYDYFDLTLKLRPSGAETRASGVGGVVFGAQDARNFYAVLADFGRDRIEVVRVEDGRETELGHAPLKKKDVDWHIVRVQHNTIISKEYIETFFDNALAVSVEAKAFRDGKIGLVTRGSTPIEFDSIHAIRIYSQHPLSPPAAYEQRKV